MIDLQKLKQEIELEFIITGVCSKNTEHKIIAAEYDRCHNRIKGILVAAGYDDPQIKKLDDNIERSLKVEL